MGKKDQAKLHFMRGQYGENWRKLRESTGKTVREFAKIIQFSYPVISKIENESAVPTIEQLIAYQETFKVSFDYLLGYTTTTHVENNKISEYTGLSEEAIEKLHSIVEKEKARQFMDDYECLLKAPWEIELYNSLICNSTFDKFIKYLKRYNKATWLMKEKIESVNKFEDLIDGDIRGYLIKALLLEMHLKSSIEELVNDYNETKTRDYLNAYDKLKSDMDNKCGIFTGSSDEDIKLVKKHLAGRIEPYELRMNTTINTIGAFMIVDNDDEE